MENTHHNVLSFLKMLTATCAVLLLSIQTINAQTVYSWGVVPQFSATAIHRDWTPVINLVEKKTGYKFKLTFYETIPGFEKSFLKGEPDLAYMNPYHAVMANEAHGYMPIIRDGKRKLVGIIVVRKDSDINNINELSGKTISFPSPNAFAASLYLRTLLHEKYKIDFESLYSGTHSNSYRHVLSRKSAASGGVKRTLNKTRKELKDSLKIIYKTEGNPSHPLTVHPRVPEEVRNAVQAALIEIGETEEGRALMKKILLPKPIKADYASDYLPLKDLKMDKYFVLK